MKLGKTGIDVTRCLRDVTITGMAMVMVELVTTVTNELDPLLNLMLVLETNELDLLLNLMLVLETRKRDLQC